jgi:hypothetical protein
MPQADSFRGFETLDAWFSQRYYAAMVKGKVQSGPSSELPKRWGVSASALHRVEDSGEWRKMGFASFPLYLESVARESKRQPSSLWRERSSGRLYNELRKKLDPSGKHFPGLSAPGVKASPEPLEIVCKIARVAPIKLVEDLERRAMEGEVTRRELRDIWETYRPVLGRRTARGRGQETPRFDPKDWKMKRALTEANSLASIVQSGPAWLGVDGKAFLYRLVHISGNNALCHLYPSTPDVVVLLNLKTAVTLRNAICFEEPRW